MVFQATSIELGRDGQQGGGGGVGAPDDDVRVFDAGSTEDVRVLEARGGTPFPEDDRGGETSSGSQRRRHHVLRHAVAKVKRPAPTRAEAVEDEEDLAVGLHRHEGASGLAEDFSAAEVVGALGKVDAEVGAELRDLELVIPVHEIYSASVKAKLFGKPAVRR